MILITFFFFKFLISNFNVVKFEGHSASKFQARKIKIIDQTNVLKGRVSRIRLARD